MLVYIDDDTDIILLFLRVLDLGFNIYIYDFVEIV